MFLSIDADNRRDFLGRAVGCENSARIGPVNILRTGFRHNCGAGQGPGSIPPASCANRAISPELALHYNAVMLTCLACLIYPNAIRQRVFDQGVAVGNAEAAGYFVSIIARGLAGPQGIFRRHA